MMYVNEDKCIGCGKCVRDCFPNDIEVVNKKAIIHNKTCFECGHCIAVCPTNAITIDADTYDMNEVQDYNPDSFDIQPDTLLNFIKFRRSIRQYKKQPIEKDKLSKVIQAGRFTQTAVNQQDVSYTVVMDQIDTVKSAVFETLKSMGQAILADGTSDSRLLNYAGLWLKMYESYKSEPQKADRLFFNAPAIIVVSALSEVDAGLASSNMELMANSLGLGTFFSGFFVAAASRNPQIKTMLNIPENKKIVTCMILGYPAVSYKRTVPRKKALIEWM